MDIVRGVGRVHPRNRARLIRKISSDLAAQSDPPPTLVVRTTARRVPSIAPAIPVSPTFSGGWGPDHHHGW